MATDGAENPLVFHDGNWKLLVMGEPDEYQEWPMIPINSPDDVFRELNLRESRRELFEQSKQLTKELEKLLMNEEQLNEIINHEWSDGLSFLQADLENDEIDLELERPDQVVSFNRADAIALARYFELTEKDLDQ